MTVLPCQILELIKGTEGTKVKLDVIRPSDGQVLSIELSRKKVTTVGIVSTSNENTHTYT